MAVAVAVTVAVDEAVAVTAVVAANGDGMPNTTGTLAGPTNTHHNHLPQDARRVAPHSKVVSPTPRSRMTSRRSVAA